MRNNRSGFDIAEETAMKRNNGKYLKRLSFTKISEVIHNNIFIHIIIQNNHLY